MNDLVPRRNIRRRAFIEALLKLTTNKKELKKPIKKIEKIVKKKAPKKSKKIKTKIKTKTSKQGKEKKTLKKTKIIKTETKTKTETSKQGKETYSRNRMIFSRIARDLRQVYNTKDVCVNINTCISLGLFSKKLYNFFNDFKNFKFVKKGSRLGAIGENGVLYVLLTSMFNYNALTLLKTMPEELPHKDHPDHLLYEYIIGIQLNKFNETPNILTTLNLYRFKDIKAYKYMYNNKNPSIDLKHLNGLQLINHEMVNNNVIADSCKHPQLYALEQLFVPHSQTLASKLTKQSFVNDDLVNVLFQVHAFLRIYQNIYTHYDLHDENILLIEIPNSTLSFSYIDTNPSKHISFNSKYLVKFIDYGRSYCQKVTETFRDSLCNVCEKCGENKGYQWLSNTLDGPLVYLNNSSVNRTADLRLLQFIKNENVVRDPTLNAVFDMVHFPKVTNPEIKKSGLNENKIFNVEDAYQVLFKTLESKQKQDKSNSNTVTYGKFTINTTPVKSIEEINKSVYTFKIA